MRCDAPRVVVLISVLLSWLASTIHDLVELPGLVPADPQYTIPTAILIVLTASWLIRPNRLTQGLLLAWLLLGLAGTVLTVLPVNVLEFLREQSVGHYVLHIGNALVVLPAISALRPRRGAPRIG